MSGNRMTSEATRPSINFSSSRFFSPFLSFAGAAEGGRRSEPWAPNQMMPMALKTTSRYWGSSSLAKANTGGAAILTYTDSVGEEMSAMSGELFSEDIFWRIDEDLISSGWRHGTQSRRTRG